MITLLIWLHRIHELNYQGSSVGSLERAFEDIARVLAGWCFLAVDHKGGGLRHCCRRNLHRISEVYRLGKWCWFVDGKKLDLHANSVIRGGGI